MDFLLSLLKMAKIMNLSLWTIQEPELVICYSILNLRAIIYKFQKKSLRLKIA